jgi:molecular chaperone DnaK (HSP70)
VTSQPDQPVAHGIDFGTSTSLIMVGRPGVPSLLVKDPLAAHGEVGVPTSVCARPDGSLAVGFEAERIKQLSIRDYRTGFKLEVGMEKADHLGGRSYSPDQLMAEVIRFLRGRALAVIPAEPAAVVLTVPVKWQEWTRDLAVAACADAGYDPAAVRLETEPVAAMAGLGPLPGRTVVYDLGGGTFDCAVAVDDGHGPQIYGEPFGLRHVGGRAFDERVLRHLRDTYPQAERVFEPAAGQRAREDVDPDLLRRRVQLREKCVEAKIELSFIESTRKLLSEVNPAVLVSLDRATLSTLIGDLVEETADECERMLKGLGLAPGEIAQFLQIGGSSRVPLTAERLAKRFGRPVTILEEPELAVVRGATELALRTTAFAPDQAARPAPVPPAPVPPAPVPPAPDPPHDAPAQPGGTQPRRITFDPARNLWDE